MREIFRGKLISKVDDVKVRLFQISGTSIKRLHFLREKTSVYELKIQGCLRITNMMHYLNQIKKSHTRSINIFELRPAAENEARYDRLEK